MKRKPPIVIIDPSTLSLIGHITRYTTLIWEPKFNGIGNFEFWCELSEENIELIQKERIIWLDNNSSGVILSFEESVEDGGVKKLNIKGKTLNHYISRRIIWGTHIEKDEYISNVMFNLVNENMINPIDVKRKIKNVIPARNDFNFGEKINYQKTGGNVEEELESLCEVSRYSLGFSIHYNHKEKALLFDIRKGKDRTRNNSDGNHPVVLSTDLKDILESKYSYSCQDEKTIALVAGEDVGVDRKKITTGDDELEGFQRKELFVDARDLKMQDEEGKEISQDDYNSMLSERGLSKLGEYVEVQNFSAKIRSTGHTNYEFGIDYELGDVVTIEDKVLGVELNAVILEIRETWESTGYSLVITFGYSQLNISKKIKRMIR